MVRPPVKHWWIAAFLVAIFALLVIHYVLRIVAAA
jgi:hypothetical protein